MVDGFGVLAWARAQADLKGLLIVVLSSSDQPEALSRAQSLGADNYLVKTNGYREVISAVRNYLNTACRNSSNVNYTLARIHTPGS